MKIFGKKNRIVNLQNSKINAANSFIQIQNLLEIEKLGFFRIFRNNITLSDLARSFFGFQKNETITTEKVLNRIHNDDKETIKSLIFNPSQSPEKNETVFRIVKENNDFKELLYVRSVIHLNMIDEKNNEFEVTGTIRDISKEEKNKKELIRLKEKAEESDKLKTTFLSNISHEIRTPMNSILGFTELLKISDIDSRKKKEYIKIIKQQGQQLLQFIDNIVDLTKIESGNIQINKTPCNLNLLLNEILLRFNRQKILENRENLEITTHFPEKEGIVIYTDAGRLQQIIYCLIHNSLKSIEKGNIEFGYYKTNDSKIEFYIKDTGSGYSKEEQKYIFNRYQYTDISEKVKYEGSGLDLTIAKALVKLLGGKIWIDSEINTGSTFYFMLPYEDLPENKINTPFEIPETEMEYKWKDKVILIAEDEEENALFLEAVFHDTGVKTITAKNGAQAVELCRSINKIDIILMDIKMPVLNGISATKRIREFNQDVPVIAQTAISDEQDINKMRIAGCNDYILKPIEIEKLFRIVNRYLGE